MKNGGGEKEEKGFGRQRVTREGERDEESRGWV